MNKKEIKRKRDLIQVRKSVEILEKEIAGIRYVKDWVILVGCSKTKLNRLISAHYGISPKVLMKQIRYERIKETIKRYPKLGSYAVACECGLPNEKVLYQFLSRNFGTSFSELRFEIIWKKERKVQNG